MKLSQFLIRCGRRCYNRLFLGLKLSIAVLGLFVLDLSRQVRRLTEELESAKNELQPLKELLSLRSAWVQTLQRRKVSSLLVSGL